MKKQLIGFLVALTFILSNNAWASDHMVVFGKQITAEYYGMYLLLDQRGVPLRDLIGKCDCSVAEERVKVFFTKELAEKEKEQQATSGNKMTVKELDEETLKNHIIYRLNNGEKLEVK